MFEVGTFAVSVTFTPDDGENFAETSKTVNLTVNKATLTIKADDMSRPPGVTGPPPTATYSGFVNGDTAANLDTEVQLTPLATIDSPPGDYLILAGGAADANYEIIHGNGTLTITDKEQPEIVWTPSAITYGTPLGDDQLNAIESNGITGEFSYSHSHDEVLNAGVHTLEVTFVPDNQMRYLGAGKSVNLTVNKAPLTIKADNQSRPPREPNPTPTASYAGFVNGDTAASLDTQVDLRHEADIDSPQGEYRILASGASDPNYAITFEHGLLTITSKLIPEIFWIEPMAITYGEALSGTQLNATVVGDPPRYASLHARHRNALRHRQFSAQRDVQARG